MIDSSDSISIENTNSNDNSNSKIGSTNDNNDKDQAKEMASQRLGGFYIERDPIVASLEADEDHHDDDELGIMQTYISKIHDRLQYEFSDDVIKELVDTWLVLFLKENDFWLLKEKARVLCGWLKLNFNAWESTYRSIRVWLPDKEFK